MRILVTGGAGSSAATCPGAFKWGHEVVAFDNLCNADVKACAEITGKGADLLSELDRNAWRIFFSKEEIDAVITLQASRPGRIGGKALGVLL